MGSRSYVFPEKGFVLDESISAPHVIERGENGLMMCSYASSLVVTNEEAIENQGFEELVFSETRKDLVMDVLSTKVGGEKICTPITSTRNAFSGEEESRSMFSSTVVESNGQDPLLIDLKLSRIADHRDAQDFRTSKVAPILSSAESSAPAKRARAALSSQTPFCQVHGCKKDLSPSKDYYKRHKVCEVHSKTPKVIVNGIEQRFCQQCSRFHLLAQFDDGKRSCRKRLADHNVRRRKPRAGIHSDRTGRLFQSYNGSRFQGSKLRASSLACPDIQLQSNLLCPQKYGMGDWIGHTKLERGADYCPQSATPVTYEYLHPKSPFPNGYEKQNHPFHVKVIKSATGREFNENSNEYLYDLVALNSVSDSLIKNPSMGSEDLILFDSSSSGLGVSGMLTSGCALSLLSPQSQSSSSHSPGIPIPQPLTVCGSHTCYHVGQLSRRLLEQASISRMSNKYTSTGMNSVEEDHFDPILISDEGYTVNFTGGILQGSQYINAKAHLSREDEPIIDLLQLSSQLQRVESQRQSMQAKQEKDAFFGLKVT